MKKITITLLLFMFVLKVMGQMSPLSLPKEASLPNKLPLSVSLNIPKANLNTRTNNKFLWLNYGLAINAIYGTSEGSGTFLFPDSSVLVNYVSATGDTIEPGNPFVHAIGNILDIYSANLAGGYDFAQLPTTLPYTLDSMAVTIAYSRHDTTTDTLMVYLLQAARNSADLPLETYEDQGGNTYWLTNYGDTELQVPFELYNYKNNALASKSAAITTIKVPLTEADTSVTLFHSKEFALPTTMNVSAGNLVGCAVAFKPGYAYRVGENVDSFENVLNFESLDEVPGGYPYYTPGDDYNSSGIVTNSVRYNIDQQGYDGFFVPAYAYTSAYTLDDHLIYYHIGFDSTAGINTVSSLIATQIVYPNPAPEQAMLKYTLKTSASVIINVSDVTGKIIMSMNEGNLSAGLNQQVINTKNLANGVYMISLIANGNTSVSKLVVTR